MDDQSNSSSKTLSIAKLAEALAKAQAEFSPIPKDSKVEVYSKPPERRFLYEYYYADLTTIIDKTRPALSKNGICFTQGMVSGGFATTLIHSSGEKLVTGFIPCQIKATDYKEIAGAITYLKRISLSAALGVSADEDVDAASEEAKAGNQTEKSDTKNGQTKALQKKSQPAPKPKNHAPGADNELDAHLGSPDELAEEAKLAELQEYLIYLVEQRGIAFKEMPAIIEKCVGRKAKSSELSIGELEVVISYVKMK